MADLSRQGKVSIATFQPGERDRIEDRVGKSIYFVELITKNPRFGWVMLVRDHVKPENKGMLLLEPYVRAAGMTMVGRLSATVGSLALITHDKNVLLDIAKLPENGL